MRPRLITIILLTSFVLTGIASGGQRTYASCLVRITSDPEILDADEDVLAALANSSFIKTDAGLADCRVFVSQARPDSRRGRPVRARARDIQLFKISIVPQDEGGELPPEHGREYLGAICDRLQQALAQDYAQAIEHSRSELQSRLADIGQRREESSNRLEGLRSEQRELIERAGGDPSRESIVERMRDLDHQRQQMEMELHSSQARRNAIEQQIANLAAQWSPALDDSTALARLREHVASEQEDLVILEAQAEEEQRKGSSALAAVEREQTRLRIRLEFAKAKLAEQEAQLRMRGGGEMLPELNQQLVHLSIETAELQARLEFVREQLQQIEAKDLLALADRYAQMELEAHLAAEAFERASRQADELKTALDNLRDTPPVVTIVGAEPKETD